MNHICPPVNKASRRSIRRLGFCREGTVLIEFAILAPVLLMLVFGSVEFSLIMFAKSVMEGATGVTARLGKTGYSEDAVSREDMIKNLLVEQSEGILDPTKIEISYQIYPAFDSIHTAEPYVDANHSGQWDAGETYTDINGNAQWDNDMGQAGLGGPGDIVVYYVRYPWKVLFPLISETIGDENGDVILESTVVVRNEPYQEKVI